MNTEQLHDALGMLPEDLIAETDALRRRKTPKVVSWKRILPVAACLVLLLTAPALLALLSPKGAMECADEAAPAEAAVRAPAAAQMKKSENPAEVPPDQGRGGERSVATDENVFYSLTARYLPVQPSDTEGGQRITVISDREALETYLADNGPADALTAACKDYDEAYFEDHQLVLLLTAKYRPASSYSGNVLLPMKSGSWSAEQTDDGSWILRVRDMVPDVSAGDVVRQHIILELPGQLIAPTDTITLTQEP